MGDDTDDSREMGIEFGSLAEDLESQEYPISHDDLLEKYGDRELELQSGTVTLGELLGPENEAEYEDADAVRQAIFNMVGDEAVGRKGYSDRGGEAQAADDDQSA